MEDARGGVQDAPDPLPTTAPLTAEPEGAESTPLTIQEDSMIDPPTDTGLQGFAALRGGKPACTICRIAAIKPGDYICHHCRREKAAGKTIDPGNLSMLQAFDRMNVFEETYVPEVRH